MPQDADRILPELARLRAAARALDPEDNAALIALGAGLEALVGGLADDAEPLPVLLLALQALQALYERTAPQPHPLAAAVVVALDAVEAALGDGRGTSLAAARDMLADALAAAAPPAAGDLAPPLELPPDAERDAASDAAAPEAPTLDDLAALLLQLGPADADDLLRVADGLTLLAADRATPGAALGVIAQAVQLLDDVAAGRAADPHAALGQVGRGIQAAMDLLDPDARATAREAMQAARHTGDAPPEADADVALADHGRTSVGAGLAPPEPGPVGGASPAPALAPPADSPPAPIPPDGVAGSLPPDADRDLLAEFILESREYIEGAEAALLSLETDPDDAEAINTVFRAFHTVKGTSGFLGLASVSELAHGAESLLSRVRDREIRFTGGYADLALRAVDLLKDLIQAVQDALGGEPLRTPPGYAELLGALADPPVAGVGEHAGGWDAGAADEMGLGERAAGPHAVPRLGEILVAQGKAEPREVEAAARLQGGQPIGMALVKAEVASVTDVARALRTQQRLAGAEGGADAWLRVRTDRLDQLIDMVGELVIAHSMVAQDNAVQDTTRHDLARKVTHAGKIVRELQDLSMSMRMVPLKATFQKMARLVRDVAHKQGKQVELLVEGEDTEIDRHMVDAINDPLVHMIRNACDHGIEAPEARVARGKPAGGTVRLSAAHAGGSVVVEIRDDGKGLDRARIAAKAVERGLIESDKGMSESEVFGLIFEPGFSTAERVTDVSGRGVGMDVVRRNIQSLRGRIEIASEAGRGTTFRLHLPLTLAITDGMLVKVGQERYIVPTVSIAMSFRPAPEALFTLAGRGELVMLRGDLLPIVRLHRLFGAEGAVEDLSQGLLVVVGEGDLRCALLVDELLGQQQAVAKSLGQGIGKIRGISGGAILGDGRVGLILDTTEVLQVARQGADPDTTADVSPRAA